MDTLRKSQKRPFMSLKKAPFKALKRTFWPQKGAKIGPKKSLNRAINAFFGLPDLPNHFPSQLEKSHFFFSKMTPFDPVKTLKSAFLTLKGAKNDLK